MQWQRQEGNTLSDGSLKQHSVAGLSGLAVCTRCWRPIGAARNYPPGSGAAKGGPRPESRSEGPEIVARPPGTRGNPANATLEGSHSGTALAKAPRAGLVGPGRRCGMPAINGPRERSLVADGGKPDSCLRDFGQRSAGSGH